LTPMRRLSNQTGIKQNNKPTIWMTSGTWLIQG